MKQTIEIDYNTFNTNTGGCRLNYCDMMYVTLFIIVKELSDDIRVLCNSYKKDLPGHSWARILDIQLVFRHRHPSY